MPQSRVEEKKYSIFISWPIKPIPEVINFTILEEPSLVIITILITHYYTLFV